LTGLTRAPHKIRKADRPDRSVDITSTLLTVFYAHEKPLRRPVARFFCRAQSSPKIHSANDFFSRALLERKRQTDHYHNRTLSGVFLVKDVPQIKKAPL
jgi:hypothetical protein